MNEWDKLDQEYSGGEAVQGSGDPWADLDAQFTKPQQAAAQKQPVKTVSQLPQNGAKQTRMDRLIQGIRDPIDGGAQLLTNIMPEGLVSSVNTANNWLADNTGMVGRLPEGGVNQQVQEREIAYQQARRDAMPETIESQISGKKEEPGLDGYRLAGNVISPVNLAAGARVPIAASTIGKVATGAAVGAGLSALNPVVVPDSGNYADEKLKQMAAGGVFGAALPLIGGGLSRIISPNASKNANLQMLKDEGVNPTVGQALGGRWNAAEEKLTSLPIMGDAISMARGRGLEQFNKAAINRAVKPIGEKVDDVGQKGIMQAGDKLSSAYDDALNSLGPVSFDNTFAAQASQLQGMANNLVPAMRDKFMNAYRDIVVGRMSPNGSMLPETFKKVDSELGTIASRYGKSGVASEQEAGDAIKQLQTILLEQAKRSNPNAGAKLDDVDKGWANLVRIEGAGGAAKNSEGVFTPGQLNSAIRTADQSVRKRAMARGTALMQDLGNAGQAVLGNKVPNSFTADRGWMGAVGIGSGVVSPWIPAGLLGGAAAYTSPAQKALVAAVSKRPESAKKVAEALRKRSMLALPVGTQATYGLLGE